MHLANSIKSKLLIFTFCISLIPIATLTSVYYLDSKNSLKSQILKDLKAIAESRKQHILSTVEKIKVRTIDYSSDGLIRNEFEAIIHGGHSQQKEISRLNKYLLKYKLPLYHYHRAIILVDKDGKVVSATNKELLDKDFSNQDVFKQGISKGYGEPYVGQPHYSPYLNLKYLCVSAPIISRRNSELLGVVVNVYDIAILNNITTDRIGMGKTGEVYLANKEKIMITESRFIEDAYLKQTVASSELVSKAIKEGMRTGIYKDYRGVSVVGTSIYMPEFNWVLVAKIDKAEAFAPLRMLGIIAVVFGIGSIAIVSTIGTIFALSISRPIKKVTEAMKEFACGNFKL